MGVFETPLGLLSDLDLDSSETCLEVLALDKHQIAEGMVVESLFDQIMERMPSVMDGDVNVLDVETFIASAGGGGLYAFVWWRTAGPGLGRYLLALEKRFSVLGVRLSPDGGDFEVCPIRGGKRCEGWSPIHDFLAKAGLARQAPYKVSHDVRDRKRQFGAFWGYLQHAYGGLLKERVALPRILVNWGIQPWFRYVWNLDRVLVHGERIWVLEAKHKYPFRRGGQLCFGLNNGEARLLERLGQCGIGGVHVVVVKPYWDMDTGSMYLLTNYEAKQRAMLVGLVVDQRCAARILSGNTGTSGTYTSVTGSLKLAFKTIPIEWFCPLASLSDPDRAADRLVALMEGRIVDGCTDGLLEGLRMDATGSKDAGAST